MTVEPIRTLVIFDIGHRTIELRAATKMTNSAFTFRDPVDILLAMHAFHIH
jgi:hypothetical protein